MKWKETARRTSKDVLVVVYVGTRGWTIHKLRAWDKAGQAVWSYTVKRDDGIKAVGLRTLDDAEKWVEEHPDA